MVTFFKKKEKESKLKTETSQQEKSFTEKQYPHDDNFNLDKSIDSNKSMCFKICG